jgi:rhodanese-related sulfurtransferase
MPSGGKSSEQMTNFFGWLRQCFRGETQAPNPPLPVYEPEPEAITVPEIMVSELQQELNGDQPPLLLDVREPYEWRQVHIPTALHIPMNELPARLSKLPHTAPIVVLCAHGSRSYEVAGYLIEQGYSARSLAGGISEWACTGGAVSR